MRPSSSCIRETRGSALILFLAAAAAISIVAAALVILIVNTQHGTAMERQRSKAFNVAEAALDVAMQELGQRWPTSATNASWFDAAAFAGRFSSAEFPGADSANPRDFVQVRLTDNADSTKAFDWNGDGLVFVDAQARVGKKAARVHAQVEATYFDPNPVRGLALWAGGDVTSKGGDPKVTVEVFPPGDTSVSWAATGSGNPAVGASYMTLLQGPAAPSREEVLSDETIQGFVELAQRTGRYFTSTSAPAATPELYGGLCVIQAGPEQQPVKLTGNTIYNSEEQPGVLLVLGGAGLQFAGTTQFFGIIYVQGVVETDTSHGTPVIHGMLITEEGFLGAGTPDIRYNDRCVRGANTQFPTGSRMVPGYWRELRPTM